MVSQLFNEIIINCTAFLYIIKDYTEDNYQLLDGIWFRGMDFTRQKNLRLHTDKINITVRVTIHVSICLTLELKQFTDTRSSRQLLNVSLRLVAHEICEIQMAYL
jgi:hypothetical protein